MEVASMNLAGVARDHCLVCGKKYARQSKPRWALDHATGELLGSVHGSCAVGSNVFAAAGNKPLEDARFTLWRFYVARPEYDSDEWYAAVLADRGRDRVLNAEQNELLEWWTTKGPLQLGADRGRGIIDAYRRMLDWYAEWHELIPSFDAVV